MTTSNTSETEETQGPRWYIVHTYSGQEDLVEKNLRLRIQSLDMQDLSLIHISEPTRPY